MHLLLFFIGTLFCIWFLMPFFTKRILNPGNMTGLIFSILLMIYGIFPRQIRQGIATALAQPGILRLLCILILALLALACLLVLINACRILSAIKAHSQQPCTLIVLGCKVYGTKASLMLEERLDAAIAYLRATPDSKCIVSGGKGDDEGISEAACMQQYLIGHGIPESRIFMEDQSRTTQENLLFSSVIIKKQGLDPHLALVSNEFHLYRSLCIAKKLGFTAYGIPAKTAWWLFPTYFVRETLAIVNEDLGLLRPKSP